jgi:hypothetical protein
MRSALTIIRNGRSKRKQKIGDNLKRDCMEMTSSPFLFKDRRACGVIVNVSVTSKGISERGLDTLSNRHSRSTRNPIHVVRTTLKPMA